MFADLSRLRTQSHKMKADRTCVGNVPKRDLNPKRSVQRFQFLAGEGEDASSTHNLLYFVPASEDARCDDQWLEAHRARSSRRRSTGG